VFGYILDERSIPSRWNPLNWFGDTFGYHYNHYTNCGRFLAEQSQPYMRLEWERLSTFTRNPELRGLAQGALRTTGQSVWAFEFSTLARTVRRTWEAMVVDSRDGI
jgi:hypothetical protein